MTTDQRLAALAERLEGTARDAEANPKGYNCYDAEGFARFLREAADAIDGTKQVIAAARRLLTFTVELCADIQVSRNYDAIRNTRAALTALDAEEPR